MKRALFAAVGLAAALGLMAGVEPLAAQAADPFDFDALFEDPASGEIVEAATIEDPQAAFFDEAPFRWAGDFTGQSGATLNYVDLWSGLAEAQNYTERLNLNLRGRLWFDARPERSLRFFGKVRASYPFEGAADFQVFELFSDFSWNDALFFRFGKQTLAWGLSRFYQIADPLSVAVKDPLDPGADLEGPLALRLSWPLGVHSLTGVIAVKDSYLPANRLETRLEHLGYGLKFDGLVPLPPNPVLGNLALNAGVYGQRDLAPKITAGWSTAVGQVQIFGDAAFSWGLDAARLVSGTEAYDLDGDGPGLFTGEVRPAETPAEGWFPSATAGFLWQQTEWKLTAYGEYLYLGAGSDDPAYLKDWITRWSAEQIPGSGLTPQLVFADLFASQSRHNSALSLSLAELASLKDLSASGVWLQNWVDQSGLGRASLSWQFFKGFAVEAGGAWAWGEDTDEWIVKNTDAVTRKPNRLSLFLNLTLGSGRF